jgi:hypothetical protein
MPSKFSWRFIALVGLVACSGGTTSARTEASPSGMQLFLLAGQSNMAGRGKVEAQDSVASPRVLKLDSTMHWVAAVDPLHWDKPAIVGVGPGRSFARALAARDPTLTIGLIPAAVGRLADLVVGTGRARRGDEDASVRRRPRAPACRAAERHAARDPLASGRVRRDAGALGGLRGEAARADRAFRADAGDPNLPFVIGQLGQFYKPGNDDVRTRGLGAPRRRRIGAARRLRVHGGTAPQGRHGALRRGIARTLGERYAMAYVRLVVPSAR